MVPTLSDVFNFFNRPNPRQWDGPVAWLVGRQLLGSIRGMLLYAAYGKKLDPRDWMDAHPFPGVDVPDADVDAFWRAGRPAEAAAEEFWFDYIADSGDGMTATYSIAYLSASKLYVETRRDDELLERPSVSLTRNTTHDECLPRGQFLFVGGDTSYHVSDYMTLVSRFQLPFSWAQDDLDRQRGGPSEPRPLFGIPGNHDYYDQLDGFRRQFRKPVRAEGSNGSFHPPSTDDAQLCIPGYERQQNASYVALRLPFEWELWGLDTEVGQIDERQQKFFTSLPVPNKLILATCAPTTVFGKFASPNDMKAFDAIKQLGLAMPFRGSRASLAQTGDAALAEGQVRLDLSGDVHQYARYWGPPRPTPARTNTRATAPTAVSYASVVSGLGGAFHHPTRTYVDEVREQALYPSTTTSTEAVSARLLGLRHIWHGGFVWLAGSIVAFIISFAANAPQSSREFIDYVLQLVSSGQEPAPIHQTVNDLVVPASVMAPRYVVALLLIAIAPVILAIVTFSRRLFHRTARGSMGADQRRLDAPKPGTGGGASLVDPEIYGQPEPWLWFWTACSTAAMTIGLAVARMFRPVITPFGSSVITLGTLLWMATTVLLSLRYTEFLFKKTHRARVSRWDWALVWVLLVVGVCVGATGLWVFGQNNLPALLTSDILFVVTVLGMSMILVAMPFAAGAELFYGYATVPATIAKAAIGAWHAALQLLVPFLLVRRGGIVTWIAAILIILASSPIGVALVNRGMSVVLAGYWVVFGALLLGLPWLTPVFVGDGQPLIVRGQWSGMWGIAPAVVAAVLGAITACSLFGWYLAVCFMFDGHNNEVGGAAQIEEFKEFVRICLRRDSLTAYVVAVDQPKRDGSQLSPKIVDVFTLRVKPAAPADPNPRSRREPVR